MRRRHRQPKPTGERDWDILEHVMRYGMSIRDVLHRQYFADAQPNAVTKVTSRLVRGQFLKDYDFELSRAEGVARKYFVLGPEGTRLFGVPKGRSGELRKRTLIEHYGTLAFCCLGKAQRERMTVRELHLFDSKLIKGKLASGPYYWEHLQGRETLGFIRTDYGSSLDQLIRNCESDIRRRMAVPAFRELILNQQFLIAIVTDDRLDGERAAKIREALNRRQWPIRFRVETVAGLFELW